MLLWVARSEDLDRAYAAGRAVVLRREAKQTLDELLTMQDLLTPTLHQLLRKMWLLIEMNPYTLVNIGSQSMEKIRESLKRRRERTQWGMHNILSYFGRVP